MFNINVAAFILQSANDSFQSNTQSDVPDLPHKGCKEPIGRLPVLDESKLYHDASTHRRLCTNSFC